MRKAGTLTCSIVLVVIYELRNGAKQVLLCQVKRSWARFGLSDLVMLHSRILLPVRPDENICLIGTGHMHF